MDRDDVRCNCCVVWERIWKIVVRFEDCKALSVADGRSKSERLRGSGIVLGREMIRLEHAQDQISGED